MIGAAGFGRRIGWKDELIPPPGHKMSFKVRYIYSTIHPTFIDPVQDALAISSHGAVTKALVPNWALPLTKYTLSVKTAYEELEVSGQKLRRHVPDPLRSCT